MPVRWHGTATTAVVQVETCAGIDTINVLINDPGVTYAAPNIYPPVFCLGEAVMLEIYTANIGPCDFQWYENNASMGGAQTSPTLNINVATYYSVPGTYSYYAIETHNGCPVKSNLVYVIIEDCTIIPDTSIFGCPAVAFFRTYVFCNQIWLINKSFYVPPATGMTYQWSITAITGTGTGTFLYPYDETPDLTVSESGTYDITLTVTSSTGCISSWTETVDVLLPVADFSFTTPVCENIPDMFTAIPNSPNYNYYWNFDDGSTSYDAITQHSYATGYPTQYSVYLEIYDSVGCLATKTDYITVNPTPVCTITASDTIFCPGSFVTLTACSGMSSYQWYRNDNPISGANNPAFDVYEYGEYWVEVTNNYLCSNISNKIYIYVHPLPKAKITGDGYICAVPGRTAELF